MFVLAKQHRTTIVPRETKYKTIFHLKTTQRILIPCILVQTLSTYQQELNYRHPPSQDSHLLTEKYNKTISKLSLHGSIKQSMQATNSQIITSQ